MAYLRTKIINGRPYFYLVSSVRVKDKVKQKVIRYIGTLKNLSEAFQAENIKEKKRGGRS